MQKIYIYFLFLILSCNLQAQCPKNNKSFKAGESLEYDLYFKYGLIHMEAGDSKITVQNAKYGDKEVYQMTMTAQSAGVASKIFSLSDTIISYMTHDMIPLKYQKYAHEGGDYTNESIIYDYKGKKTKAFVKRSKNGSQKFDEELNSEKCLYDMFSVVFYSRTLDFDNMKNKDVQNINFISGKRLLSMDIKLEGTESVKANNKKYECFKLVLRINDKAFEDKQDAMIVYLSKDKNRLPVRIDSKLKIGSTRVILKKANGLLE